MAELLDRLQAHVDELVQHHGIAVVEKAGASPRAGRMRVDGARVGRIVIRPIRGRNTYFTALHEIGHLVAVGGLASGLRLEQEVIAWRWALDNAIEQPTPGVWKKIARCLGHYVDRAERWANMKLPAPEHDFWALLAEARRNA